MTACAAAMLYKLFALAVFLQPADGLILTPSAAIRPVSSVASPLVVPRVPTIEMGRGDKRTAKGKRKAGSHGNCRPDNGELRRRRNGPMTAAAPSAAAAEPVPEPMPEPVPEPVAEAAPEPEPAADAAPALSAGELMKLVKTLKAELPRAEMKACKEALEANGGDVAAAKASIEAEMASVWAAEDEAKAEALKEGTVKLMEMRDAKAQKKFAEAEAKASEAAAEAGEAPPVPETAQA